MAVSGFPKADQAIRHLEQAFRVADAAGSRKRAQQIAERIEALRQHPRLKN